MKEQDKTPQELLEDKKKAFLALYGTRPDLTMFTIAIQSGLGLQTLTEELKKDRQFYAQTKELCGQRIKREVEQKQQEDGKEESKTDA